MSKYISPKLISLTFGILIICFAVGFYAFAVWTGPTAAPPDENTQAPCLADGTNCPVSGEACLVSGDNIVCSGIPANSVGSLVVTKNAISCPIWKDCDGDTFTYGYKDCDESCKNCFVGSGVYTASPDNLDQNCNGTLDDLITFNPACPTSAWLPLPGACNQATDDAKCKELCQQDGYYSGQRTQCLGSYSADFYGGGYCGGCPFPANAPSMNFSNCYYWNPSFHVIHCSCSGYQ